MPKMNWRCRTALACAAAIALSATAQTPAPPAKQETPVIRKTTRLVQLSVIVTNKDGQPVTDLGRDDFELFDNGKPQAVSVFSMESVRTIATPSAPLPPNTYTNRLERRGEVPTSVTVILLDTINTSFHDRPYAKQQILKFLGQIRPEDRIALYVLSNRGVSVLHDFTSDATPLLRALARYQSREEHQVAGSEPDDYATGFDDFDSLFANQVERMSNFYLQDRVSRTVDGLEAIAHHLGGLPGRKNLVWVSATFPISFGLDALPSQSNLSPERGIFTGAVERAARALNEANLAVYPVDARGLIGAFGTSAQFATMMGGRGGKAITPRSPFLNHDTMVVLADRTGGRAFYNTNDISGAVRRAVEDSRVTYELGFYPTHGQWNGRWHELKVQVKRRGVQVRYRRGYFAYPDRELDDKARRALLLEAALSPLDATALAVTVQAQPGTEANQWRFVLRFDPQELQLTEENGTWTDQLDVLIVQRSARGQIVDHFETTIVLKLPSTAYEQLKREGFALSKHIVVNPAAEELRVIVRDANSGAIGSVNIRTRSLAAGGTR